MPNEDHRAEILPILAIVIVVLVLLVLFSFLGLILKYYKRCPSNRVLVIYGMTGNRAAKCIAGGARSSNRWFRTTPG